MQANVLVVLLLRSSDRVQGIRACRVSTLAEPTRVPTEQRAHRGAGALLAKALRAVRGLALLGLVSACGGAPEDDRPSFLLVTVDTLRSDCVGSYGFPVGTTPEIDRLAKRGVLFEEALATSCFTAPSMASIATGQLPVRHGVLDWGDRGVEDLPTLAERLQDAGYRVGFFSAHGAIAEIGAITRGFDGMLVDDGDLDGRALTDRALAWIGKSRRPFFAWVHYFEPHAPYEPPEERARRVLPVDVAAEIPDYLPRAGWLAAIDRAIRDEGGFETVLPALYAAEVADADAEIGRLVRAVEGRVGPERLVVAFTADHGENLADHEPFFDHRNALYESLVRVPLLLCGPGIEPRRERRAVSNASLYATFVELAGASGGADAAPSLLDDPRPTEPLFLDSGLQEIPHKAIRAGDRKVVRRLQDGRVVWFDLASDPGETRPLEVDSDAEAAAMAQRLATWLSEQRAASRARPSGDLSAAERRRLEALGYFAPAGESVPRDPAKTRGDDSGSISGTGSADNR